ncbi:MAG: DEAD/DEAH box helicase [Cyanobacteria bacterium SID2]|nr:DEAD/DEAH box helicase [Cyanobacteria bacterium SID2]MBP0004077.1 DEAD/DEAH box helicase [Cyanobacteria bacterium SBC]
MSALDLNTLFPFQLDDFQHQAIEALNAGKSAIVCAPTGSGKTLIGEYAIYRALVNQRRVFYTTPLKALSNQKLRDFQKLFGPENVGLLTGDISLNRNASVLVMTTEIFRNMLYGTPIGEVGTSVQGVETVILDECHYMNDRQRGTVWEESIIYCPLEIQLVGLSATVANSDQLTDWIDSVHGPTELIYSEFRPVPLQFLFCNRKGVFPLLDKRKQRLNPRLKPRNRTPKNRRGKRRDSLAVGYVVSQLQQRDMLPAIYFIFSRRGCDRAVSDLGDISLVNAAEAQQLKLAIDEFLAHNPDAGRAGQVEPLYRGIAAHHAGILPAWKGFVENLFQRGLIKVVFATETLAAGINMPARTTVISSLSKRTDLGHRLLTASEFLQMAGRAGRRGMDEQGYVVTLETPFEGAVEAAHLATSTADPLVSQFTPTYGMVLNLLQTHTIDEAKELVERSFGQYLASLSLRPQQQAIEDLEAELSLAQSKLETIDPQWLQDYEKLHQRLKEERRILKTLKQQAGDVQHKSLVMALQFAVAGTILRLKGKNVPVADPLSAVLVTKVPGSGQAPYLVCLGANDRWYVVSTKDVVSLHGEFPRLEAVDTLNPPSEMPLKPGQSRQGDEMTAAIVARIPSLPPLEVAPEVLEWEERVAEIDAQLKRHPLRQLGNPGTLIERAKRVAKLQRELSDRNTKIQHSLARHWEAFLDLIDILIAFDCLDEDSLKPTQLGELTAAIRGDNELWLGLALSCGELDRLEPEQFAAACASLVTEISRPDTWTNYEVSPEVDEALAGLRGLRRQLFQVQRRYQAALPVWLERDAIALVEQWARGVEWPELCSNTSLDEGDIVRILRRTLDVLSQIPHVPHLNDVLRTTAREASNRIDRFPVNEEID